MLRLNFKKQIPHPYLKIFVAGYPVSSKNMPSSRIKDLNLNDSDKMDLFIEIESDGRIQPIEIASNPGETWSEIIFRNPGEPFSIIANDGSEKLWLAISTPVPIGRITFVVSLILHNWWIFGAAGVGCFVAGFLFSSTGNRRLT